MRIFFLAFVLFFPQLSYSNWNEVDCSSINRNIDLLNSNYSPQRCWSSIGGSVRAFAGAYEDSQNYIWFEAQEITVGNSRWGSNYAFDNLKKDKLIDVISMYNLGNNPIIDNKASKIKSSNGKLIYYHKNFETSDGKGVVGGNSMDKMFYEFGFFTVDKSANLNEDFISELLSSLKVLWANKGVQTSISLSSNLNSNLSSQDSKETPNKKDTVSSKTNSSSNDNAFLKMCKNSKLSDLDKDVAMLCIEKMNK
jgi:hypothetical protein